MSIERTRYGTWRARWRENGVQRAKSFRRKVDAQLWLDQVRGDIARGTHTPSATTKLTVTAMADVWLTSAMNLGAGGRDTYRRDLDRYILPRLGDIPIAKLTPQDVEAFLATELDAGLAPSTVHRHYRTLRRLCQVAVDRGHLRVNPCAKVTPPQPDHTEMRFLTAAQLEALADALPARYRAWALVAGYGGLRWSELVGLRRSDVEGPRVTVAGQLVRRADGQWHRDPPKTRAGRRTITLPDSVGHELATHIATYALPGRDGLVFPTSNGTPLLGPSFTGNVFKPALRRAGLDPAMRIHDLRHTAVALAIAAGGHPKAIQARMGHASISVTLDRYGHLFPEQDADLASALDQMRG